MKKRLFRNQPNRGDRGQYVFFDETLNNINDSNGVATNLFDKFDKRDLYTKVIDDAINDTIIRNKLVPIGGSFLEFDEIKIVNSGVKHDIRRAQVEVVLLDGGRYNQNIKSMGDLLTENNLTSIPTVGGFQEWVVDNQNQPFVPEAVINYLNNLAIENNTVFNTQSEDPMKAGFMTLLAGFFPHRLQSFSTLDPSEVLERGKNLWIYDTNQQGRAISEGRVDITKPDDFDVRDCRIFLSDVEERKAKKDWGTILKNQKIMEYLGLEEPNLFSYKNDLNFSPYNSFDINSDVPGFGGSWEEDDDEFVLQLNGTPIMFDKEGFQDIYVAVFMRGDADRWWGTDPRRQRIQVFKFNSSELFEVDGSGKLTEINFKYGDSNRRSGKGGKGSAWFVKGVGGAEKPAFKVEKLKLKIDTTTGYTNNVGDEIEPITYDDDALLVAETVTPAKNFEELTIEEDFLLQNNYQNIENLNWVTNLNFYNTDQSDYIMENFEPVTFITPFNFDTDLQAFQNEIEQRRISSAPNQVALDFKIADFSEDTSDLVIKDTTAFDDILGYKFYVVSWDDIDDKFKIPDDYFKDIPTDVVNLNLKQIEEDLYKFSDIGTPLIHGYSSSGIKTIKGVLFSYTKTGFKQIVRYKFFESKIFLDLPLTKYPDFIELGGNDYTTIPYPYTTPVIGGSSNQSNYYKTLKNTIGSGKISEDELVTERILVEAFNNDELGESILEFDLEQCRYFDEPYSMSDLLDIPLLNNDFTPHTSNYWDGETIETSFSEESSVGQIFINDNQDAELKRSCKFEINTGELVGKSIYDSIGNSNKGLLFGEYKLKKKQTNAPVTRDSSITLPSKNNNKDGAL
tara:strand:- start:2367 stop:4910 length:2544 start_codon:yes stop_codon:yes gene_type:complete